MCCDTTKCGAQNGICRLRFGALVPLRHDVNVTSQLGETSRFGVISGGVHDAGAETTAGAVQMKPVRQCARRGAVDLNVAQASPLFSDHAPREVHLWQ